MSEVVRYTASIPPLSTVKDADTRRVLEALVTGWRTRNGEVNPNADQRFITKGELSSMVTDINNGYFTTGPGRNLLSGGNGGNGGVEQGYLEAVEMLQALQRSPLWTELGERIELIDLSIIAEQQARIAAVQQVADDLAAEAATRLGFDEVHGSAINAIQEVNETQASQISGLTTRVGDSENTIVNLQQTTATQASSLTALTSRVTDSESNITTLFETTDTQATSLTSLTTRVDGTESSIATLNETTANQATSLTTLTVALNETNSAITQEATVRANADNAIAEEVTTQVSTINASISAIQTTQKTLSDSVAALTTKTTTLQASVDDNTSAIETETTARVNADSSLSGKYSVKVDLNGYVTGFGLMSTANNATPTSDFIVRADRFSIVSPTGNKATLILTNNTIVVYDESGNPRVRIGKIA